ncbi:uncharacterized protein [Diadema antillarum]|uniref:uncharacterized protein n=1 Tax=Diadema antillarum TaxID=105358 RepID=UPI003A87CA09
MDPICQNCDDVDTFIHISDLEQQHAEIQCQVECTKATVKELQSDIIQLSKVVEAAILREKWESKLRAGETGLQYAEPTEKSFQICMMLHHNPDYIHDVMNALKEKQSALQETINSMMTALEELEKT